jgi:hypothetical protein
MSVCSTIAIVPAPSRPSPLWRAVVAGCALALALLLLLQPLICVAHCIFHAERSSAHAGAAGGFLCHAAQPDADPFPIIPAFWPGVIPALLVLARAGTVRRLAPPAPRCLDAHTWAPPLPPPRPCAA